MPNVTLPAEPGKPETTLNDQSDLSERVDALEKENETLKKQVAASLETIHDLEKQADENADTFKTREADMKKQLKAAKKPQKKEAEKQPLEGVKQFGQYEQRKVDEVPTTDEINQRNADLGKS